MPWPNKLSFLSVFFQKVLSLWSGKKFILSKKLHPYIPTAEKYSLVYQIRWYTRLLLPFYLESPPPRLYALYFFPGYLLLFLSGMLTRNIVGISVVHKKACCLILQDWLFGPDWNSFFIHPKFGYFSIEGVANEGKFL